MEAAIWCHHAFTIAQDLLGLGDFTLTSQYVDVRKSLMEFADVKKKKKCLQGHTEAICFLQDG